MAQGTCTGKEKVRSRVHRWGTTSTSSHGGGGQFLGCCEEPGGGGVIARGGCGMPSGDPRAGGHGHSAVKSHSEGKRRASFIYLCLKYLSVTRAVL